MEIQREVQAQAILLEQFEIRKTMKEALARVQSEIGPEAMNEETASYYWTNFQYEHFSLDDEELPEGDKILIKESKFLRTKRALCCDFNMNYKHVRMSSIDYPNMRFLIVDYDDTRAIFDMLYDQIQ
jgi:hypothetical protein